MLWVLLGNTEQGDIHLCHTERVSSSFHSLVHYDHSPPTNTIKRNVKGHERGKPFQESTYSPASPSPAGRQQEKMVVATVQSNSVSFPILLRQSAAKTDPKSLFLHLKARMSLHFLVNRAFCCHVTS